MDVSIIIINYNTCKMTSDCIESIFSNTRDITFEVILVDNASTDGSKEFFTQDKRINYIYSPINVGFGRANNLGYNRCIGKYVFILNSDTILQNNAIKIFFDEMESLPSKVGCLGCMLLNYQKVEKGTSYGKHLDLRGLLLMIFNQEKFNKEYHNNICWEGRRPNYFKVGYVTGADIFIRREVIEQCGLFDEDFFMYYEDAEMSWRYERNGYDNGIVIGPRIVHLHGMSSAGKRTLIQTIRRKLNHSKSEKLYFKKTGSRVRYMVASTIINAGVLYFVTIMFLRSSVNSIISFKR